MHTRLVAWAVCISVIRGPGCGVQNVVAQGSVDVIVFGVGTPKLDNGWLHVRQLLDHDSGGRGRLRAVFVLSSGQHTHPVG